MLTFLGQLTNACLNFLNHIVKCVQGNDDRNSTSFIGYCLDIRIVNDPKVCHHIADIVLNLLVKHDRHFFSIRLGWHVGLLWKDDLKKVFFCSFQSTMFLQLLNHFCLAVSFSLDC
jgi:hypothetical protein